ncbi:hypothetical protein D7X33_29705, partial [Butyricicoccus sp. 1XD8-22]
QAVTLRDAKIVEQRIKASRPVSTPFYLSLRFCRKLIFGTEINSTKLKKYNFDKIYFFFFLVKHLTFGRSIFSKSY